MGVVTLPGTGDVLIGLDGTYTPPGAVWSPASLTLNAPGALLALGTTELAPATTLALDAGTLNLGRGTLSGGTLLAAGGRLTADKATLADLVVLGDLAPWSPIGISHGTPVGAPYLTLAGTVSFLNAAGTGSGTLDLYSGVDSPSNYNNAWWLTLADGAEVAAGTIRLENALLIVGTSPTSNATATISAGATLDIRRIGQLAYGTLVNHGLITIAPGATAMIATTIDNEGVMRVGAGAVLEWLPGISGQYAVTVTQGPAGTLDLRAGSQSYLQLSGGVVQGGASLGGRFDDVALWLGAPGGASAATSGGSTLGGTIALRSADGSRPGTLGLGGVPYATTITDGTTLTSGTLIDYGDGGSGDELWLQGRMTIGPAATLEIGGPARFGGGAFQQGATALHNAGLITIDPGLSVNGGVARNDGTLSVGAHASGVMWVGTNDGAIAIAAGASIDLMIAQQGGPVTVGAGASVTFDTTSPPTHLSLAAGAHATVFDLYSTAAIHGFLADSNAAGASITFTYHLSTYPFGPPPIDNTGALLDLTGPPGAATLDFTGMAISGGTLLSQGVVPSLNRSTLRGVTLIGDLAFPDRAALPQYQLPGGVIDAATTVRRAGGGRGTIDLTNGASLATPLDDTRPIDHMDILIANGGSLGVNLGADVNLIDLPDGSASVAALGSVYAPVSGRANITVSGALDAAHYTSTGGHFFIDGGLLYGGFATGKVHFAGPGGTLDVTRSFVFNATIDNFQADDWLHFPESPDILAQNLAYDNRYLIYQGISVIDLGPNAPLAEDFIEVDDGAGGSYLSVTTPGTTDPANPATFIIPAPTRTALLSFPDPTARAMAHALLDPALDAITANPALEVAPGAVRAPGGVLVDATGVPAAMPLQARTAISIGEARGMLAAGPLPGQAVVAGDAGAIVLAGSGSGTVLASGGNNLFFAPEPDAGDWLIHWSGGDDVAVASYGNDTIAPGGGNNTVWLGAGASSVQLAGTNDVVVGGRGAATVAAGAASAAIYGGSGPLTVHEGAGTATVVGGAGGTTLTGGAGNGVFFGFGPLLYTGGTGADVLVGGTGAMTATAGPGGGVFWGGTGGVNRINITGDATAVGGYPGDTIAAFGSGTHVIYAGPGAETISAAQSTGADYLLAGLGPVSMSGGAGNSLLVAGPGGGTLSGGTGSALFEFINFYGGSAVTVAHFDPSRMLIALAGFAPGTAASALTAAVPGSGGLTLTLPDGTTVLFAGLTNLPLSAFV